MIPLCILVIWLNPGISSELRGPLFFFQVLPHILSPTSLFSQCAFIVSGFFNFGGSLIHFLGTCTDGLNSLRAAAFGYVIPVLVLLIFLLAYVLSANYCLRFNFRRNSMLRSFWLLFVLMYDDCVKTSLLILFLVSEKHVFFYDGAIECYQSQVLTIGVIMDSKESIIHGVIAILVLVFLVITPPVMVFLLTNGYWRIDPQYANTLRSGLRPEYCWWWSVDLCRRVLLVATFHGAELAAHWKTIKVRHRKSGTGLFKRAILELYLQVNLINSGNE